MIRRRAFTLIEIMLAASIFAALSVAVFTCLSNGITLWERAKKLQCEGDVIVLFDRFSSDLRNAFSHSRISFSGTELQFSFPTVVWTAADRVTVRADEVMVDQIGRVNYAYDPERGILSRRQANYSQALKDAWGPEEVVVEKAAGVKFRYFYTGSPDPRFEADPADGIPAGVEIEISVPGAKENEVKVFRRYVTVPLGV